MDFKKRELQEHSLEFLLKSSRVLTLFYHFLSCKFVCILCVVPIVKKKITGPIVTGISCISQWEIDDA